MSGSIDVHEALIYVMVTMSAVDRTMTDSELARIGSIVSDMPVFDGFDTEQLVSVAQDCGERLSAETGLDDVLSEIDLALPTRLHETAYALAVEIAAVDLNVKQEELRLLALIRDKLGLDKLTTAAIERGARARHQTA